MTIVSLTRKVAARMAIMQRGCRNNRNEPTKESIAFLTQRHQQPPALLDFPAAMIGGEIAIVQRKSQPQHRHQR